MAARQAVEKVDVPRFRFLTEDEAVQLINACSAESRPLFRAALLTGARYSELVRMTVANFDPSKSQLFVAQSKSGKSRYIPLNAAGAALFKTLTIGRAANAPMFARADGEQWGKNHQQRLLSEACKRAKITPPLRFHEARHSYASALAQAGADLLTISKLLGHADTRITSRHYAHLCDRTLANAVNLTTCYQISEPSSHRTSWQYANALERRKVTTDSNRIVNGWTRERRQHQSELIKKLRPWKLAEFDLYLSQDQ